ncbi:hypothetical protein BaRGS_00030002 [Batillaria attramentaria]|uniref:Uncharacterized protein n=1 Tax=Batillaria attramentaria TaxID=370345 RepID=A0ABD0JUM3_9CAEN
MLVAPHRLGELLGHWGVATGHRPNDRVSQTFVVTRIHWASDLRCVHHSALQQNPAKHAIRPFQRLGRLLGNVLPSMTLTGPYPTQAVNASPSLLLLETVTSDHPSVTRFAVKKKMSSDIVLEHL